MSIDQLTRRRFLQCTAGAAITASLCGSAATAEDGPLTIDCHAHIYGLDEQQYPTIDKPYRPPPGKGTLEHLHSEMQANGVRCVTAVQTSTFYRWDNCFTVDLARADPNMIAVCTLDPDDNRSAGLLEKYVHGGSVRGMRSVPARNGRLEDPGVEKLWATAQELGIVINVLADRAKRPEIERLATRFPKLRLVIDHCFNLNSGESLKQTLTDVLKLAQLPNIHAKLTFIATGSAEPYPCRDLHEPCLKIIETFGADRCVWGSGFPCELWCPKISYGKHLRIFTDELGLDEVAKQWVLGKTAQQLWFDRSIG